jgi:hypothetical protein
MVAACAHHILCVGCAVLLWCIIVMLRRVFIIYCVWLVIVCCAFLCSIYEKVAARVVIIYVCTVAARVVIIYVCTVARVSPLIYDYYNVLYGAILRFCVQNRCYLYQFIDINSIV